MAAGTDLLLAIAFLAAVGLAFVLAKALRNWVFELSPSEWGFTVLMTYSLGVLTAAYLDGDGTLILVALIPVFLALVWWVYRLYQRHQVSALRARGA